MVSSSFRRAPRVKLLCALVASCFAAEGFANPTGPAVISGSATFNTVGKNLTVTNSPNAIIHWQGFSIGAGEATRFQQQSVSSAVLNRIVGQDPSVILGTLSSNGRVFLVNPNGILFGQGSRVDVGGLVASTLNITDRDFLAGRLNFQAGAVANPIVNHGEIVSSTGGRIYLVAPDVQNHGLISSPSGEVVLAAGKTVSLVDADVPNLQVEVQAGGEALNVGKILAEGGKAGIYAGLINQRGIVRADSASRDATGRIVFKASDTTLLDAGSVTSAAGAKGGEIQVLGNKVGLAGNAQVDASGDAGGGTVLVGGDFQGKNAAIQNASRTYVGADATIKADAGVSGDGGKVIVWADDATRFYGSISARGGAQGGNGGSVEVSGKNWLDFNGYVNTLAPNGKTGQLLLDPSNIFIAASQGNATAAGMSGTNSSASTFSGGMFEASGAVQDSFLSTLALVTALTTSNVKVSTANASGTGVGNINVVDPVTYAPSLTGNLTLLAHNNINVNGAITNAGFTGASIEMYAGWDGVSTVTPAVNGLGIGSINVNQSIANNFSGTTTLTAAKDINVTSAIVSTGSGTFLTAVKGNINLSSATVSSNSNVSLSAPVGTITVNNSRVGADSTDGAVTMSAAAIAVLNSNGSNGIYAGGVEGSGTITMTATNGITVNNSALATEAGSSQAAAISLTAGGVVTVTGGSTIVADSSADASVTLNGAGGVAISGNSLVQALASNQASVSIQAANPGAAISIADSEVSAQQSFSGNNVATINMNAAGALSISGNTTIEAYSDLVASVSLVAGGTLTVGAGPSPVVEARANNSASVSLSSSGGNVAINGNVLADAGGSGNGSISISAPLGAITSGGGILDVTTGGSPTISLVARDGIGTLANPIRIQNFATLDGAVNNTGTTGDIALSFVSGGVTVGPLDDFFGLLNSNPNGTYLFQAETGNLSLGRSFAPNDVALLAGQNVIFKALAGNATLTPTGSIAASGSGSITLFADNRTGSGSTPDGVLINGGQLSADAGTISITGFGFLGAAACGACRYGGVTLVNSAAVQTNTGAISMTGTGGSFVSGAAGGQHGILLGGTAPTISTVDGAISLTGTGGAMSNASAVSDFADVRGVRVGTGVIQATGAGTIDITGFGGNLTGTNQSGLTGGVFLQGNTTTVNGNINITGSGGSTATQLLLTAGSRGVSLFGPVESTGSGSITLTGTGGTSISADGNIGVLVGPLTRTNNGSILIQGTGGTSSVSGGFNPGVKIQIGSTIQSTGTGSVTINGVAGTSGVTPQDGIVITVPGGAPVAISTAGGSLGLTATGGGLTIGDPVDGAQSVSISSGSGPLTMSASGNMTLNPVGGSISASGGAVSLSAGGNLSLGAGTTVSATDATLLANDMDIVGTVTATNSATLAASTTTQNIDIGSLALGSGPLSIGAGEINKVTAPTITIGRSDSASNILYLNEALNSGNVHATTLRLRAFDIFENGSGGISGPFNVDLIAGRNITLALNSILLDDNRNLSILADSDNQNGTLNIGAVTLRVGTGAGNTTGSMTVHAHDINAIVSGGGSGSLLVQGTGTQTITAAGNITFQNANISSGSLVAFTAGGTQTVTAGGTLSLLAGTGTDTSAVFTTNGDQVVSANGIVLTGGASGGGLNTGNAASIRSFANQNISVGSGGLTLTGGGGALTDNLAIVYQAGLAGTSQTITVHNGGSIILQGGSSALTNVGAGHGSRALIQSDGDSQLINFTAGGALSLTGGTAGSRNFAQVVAVNGSQTISGSPNITLTGGAGGGVDGEGNFALIQANAGAQSITAGNLTLQAGAGGIVNHATIAAPTQTITVLGDLSLSGGGSAPGTTGAGARIGGLGGASPTPTNLVLAVGGDVTLVGGSVAGATGSAIGSAASGTAQRTDIAMTVGGDITLSSGSASGARIGSPGSNPADGDISLTAGGNVAVSGGTAIRTLGTLAIDAGGALVLTGGSSGTGQSAIVTSGGDQTITAGSITLNGGAAGGADLSGNFAQLVSTGGAQTVTTAGNLTLIAGAAGVNNFAVVQAPTQNITVHGNLSLTGGGSSPSADGTVGGGARIGGLGGASPTATNLNLTVDGVVTMTGGSVANAGSAIGSGIQGGQTTAITMNVGGNVTLNPGTVANAGSRIGSPASNIAGGDIAITAGGTLALNSTGPGLGTAIRTLGNVTIDAASITQGADSEIISGGVTTLAATGSISLPGPNDFNQITVGSASSVTLNDSNAIVLNGVTTPGGLTVTAGGAITQGAPLVVGGSSSFNAGANAITLTNPGNDFTGTVNLTGSSASITDANALALSTSSLGGGSLVVNASGAITQGGPITAGAASFNAGSNPITLTNASNDFTGAVSLTGTNVSITDANTLTLGAVSATDLAVNGSAIDQNASGVVVGGTSTLTANTITLDAATNDFGTVAVSSPGNVSLTDANAITIANAAVAGAFNITAASTSFLSGFSANNYSFSGGSYTLAAGTYNLGGTTTIASSATVTASGATINAAGGTMNVSGTFSVFGGSVNVGTLNVLAGGALTGTGTIVGNVNNSGGTVLPGASPGVLTINGNYVQGPSGVLAIDIGGTTAGTQYDQLIVSGNASLGGTLHASLIGGFVPVVGNTFTFIQAAGGVSGTFSTINQPLGALFDTFYGPTTFQFIATGIGGGAVPAPIEPSFNQSIVSIEQALEVLLDVGGAVGPVMFGAGVVAPTTTTTPEGKIVPKPPACN